MVKFNLLMIEQNEELSQKMSGTNHRNSPIKPDTFSDSFS